MQNGDPVAQNVRLIHVVSGEHRHSALLHGSQQLPHGTPREGVLEEFNVLVFTSSSILFDSFRFFLDLLKTFKDVFKDFKALLKVNSVPAFRSRPLVGSSKTTSCEPPRKAMPRGSLQ